MLRISSVFLVAVSIFHAAASAQTWQADNGNGTYSNPLFFDEFSDPDMIRVGADFYLTGTTMHSMPGLPILRSRDLVNWTFVSYALDRLDLGPAYRLENGQDIYGQGIWAPCFRFRTGTFYIFSNVNRTATQLFRATNPAGPWTRTPMKRSFHDLSVLFDDDGKVWVVWGYQSIRLAQLTDDLTDIVPGSEREIIAPSAGMGEGLHLYKIKGKYILTSAWYLDVMRLPTARADRLTGPWEVNQNVSRGEDFGLLLGYRLIAEQRSEAGPPFKITAPDPSARGRLAMHQGGIIDTPTGEWWGFSMMDANSIGRLTALSPVTWTDGWPYFGLPGNLGRSPRIWVKPNTGHSESPHAPYRRDDDFSGSVLQPVWQWNHIPVDGKWSLTERPGFLRLHALAAQNLWTAHNTLTQRAVGPRSIPTVVMETAGMKPGDVAGFALFNRPYAWLGVERDEQSPTLAQFDEQTGQTARVPLKSHRVWLRANCNYLDSTARFSYSTDGLTFHDIGEALKMPYGLITFQGVRYAMFSYNRNGAEGGFADFDSFTLNEPNPRGLMGPIPYGRQIVLMPHDHAPNVQIGISGNSLVVNSKEAVVFTVVDRGLGRIALRSEAGFVSIDPSGAVSLRSGRAEQAETFQWIETFTGEITLMSLATNRYLRIDSEHGKLLADSPGPRPDGKDGVRFDWEPADAAAARGWPGSRNGRIGRTGGSHRGPRVFEKPAVA
jgi:xylan 1,4-beta-xylosidase